MHHPNTAGEITRLLRSHVEGSTDAFDELVGLVYGELQVMARRQLRRSRRSATLDTVGLVHETYLRLVDESSIDWECRSHFYGVMARAMRFVVVDHARKTSAAKRGGGERPVTLDSEHRASLEDPVTVLWINDAIEELEAFNVRLAHIVECRFFGGMTDGEIAESLEISTRTVQRDWRRARAWLERMLTDGLHEKQVPEDAGENDVAS